MQQLSKKEEKLREKKLEETTLINLIFYKFRIQWNNFNYDRVI